MRHSCRSHNAIADQALRQLDGSGNEIGKTILEHGPATRLDKDRLTPPGRDEEQGAVAVVLQLRHRPRHQNVPAGKNLAGLREHRLHHRTATPPGPPDVAPPLSLFTTVSHRPRLGELHRTPPSCGSPCPPRPAGSGQPGAVRCHHSQAVECRTRDRARIAARRRTADAVSSGAGPARLPGEEAAAAGVLEPPALLAQLLLLLRLRRPRTPAGSPPPWRRRSPAPVPAGVPLRTARPRARRRGGGHGDRVRQGPGAQPPRAAHSMDPGGQRSGREAGPLVRGLRAGTGQGAHHGLVLDLARVQRTSPPTGCPTFPCRPAAGRGSTPPRDRGAAASTRQLSTRSAGTPRRSARPGPGRGACRRSPTGSARPTPPATPASCPGRCPGTAPAPGGARHPPAPTRSAPSTAPGTPGPCASQGDRSLALSVFGDWLCSMGLPSTVARRAFAGIVARLQALALDPVGVRVPAFPQEQFGLPLGHHVPGREADRGQAPAPSRPRAGHRPRPGRRAAACPHPRHPPGAACFPEEFAVPTYEALPRFTADLDRLTPEQRRRLRQVVSAFVKDLRTGGPFRPGLRVKGVSRAPGVYELTRDGNGRATLRRQTSVAARPQPPPSG